MSTPVIMSVDQSISLSGVFVWTASQLHWYVIKTDKSDEMILRMMSVLTRLRKIIEDHKVTHVVIESLPYGSNSTSTRPLAALFYMIQWLCIELDIGFSEASITSVKKFATGSGKAGKDEMVTAAKQIAPSTFYDIADANIRKTTGLRDLADSLHIGRFYIKHNETLKDLYDDIIV